MNATSPLWHYTIGQSYQQILADKIIKPSAAYVIPKNWPVVWFSRNSVWECGATKGLTEEDGSWKSLTLDELREVGGGLFRIGVARESAPHNWDDFIRLSGMGRDIAAGLRRAAKEKGASIKDWFASFEPVDQAKWLNAEVWENHKWVNVRQSSSFDVSW